MGLNIKNEQTVALVKELAERTGATQTGAVEEAVRARLAELDRAGGGPEAKRLLDELHGSVTAAQRERVKAAADELYDDAGLPR